MQREPGGKRCSVYLSVDTPVSSKTETVYWQVPPFEASPSEKVAWVEEQIKEGEGYLEGQACYRDLKKNLRVFDAIFEDKTKSSLVTNQLKYNIRKFCETLAEVREIAGFSSDVPAYKKMAEMLTKVSKCVYLESDFPYQILKVLQYATVMGIGYLWPKVRPTQYGFGPREMAFDALGLLDVVPVQIPARSNDIQDCYACTVYDYMPIAEACAKFPLFQRHLQTVGRNNYKSFIQAQRQDFAATWRYGMMGESQSRSFGNLYTEIRYTFIRDIRINTTGQEMQCGDPGTSWYYKVPALGQEIFGGMRNGQPYMRPAMVEDCRIYPNLRLIITSAGLDKPMYDGTNFDWDPNFPVIQYTVDDWAWEALGRSLVGDVASIETTIRKHERLIDQVLTARLNPPMGYDLDNNGGAKIEHFDIFEPDVRLGLAGGEPKKSFQSLLPEEVQVGTVNYEYLKHLGDKELAQLGLNDVGNLANLKVNLTSDAADKQLETIGPIAKGMAMRIEKANKKVGERIKYLIPQYMSADRLVEYVGPDNIAKEMFDYNPDDLVPSHLPDEIINGKSPEEPSRYDRLTRAKFFIKKLRLVSVPSTLLKVTAMQRQMLLLQLKRSGAPLSWSTIMSALDIPNWGEAKGNDEKEKFFNEESELQVMSIIAKAKAMMQLKEMGIDPSVLMGGDQEQGGKGGKGGKGPAGQHAGGRPPSAQRSPKLSQKGGAGGAPRTVVKES
jgi:hypothetical protein